jgi:hypothetical protein
VDFIDLLQLLSTRVHEQDVDLRKMRNQRLASFANDAMIGRLAFCHRKDFRGIFLLDYCSGFKILI